MLKKIAGVLALSCVLTLLVSCVVPVSVSVPPINAKTVKGDARIVTDEYTLADETYALIIEDIQFTGTNAAGKLVIDESLDRECVLKTDGNIADTITIESDGGKITVKGDESLKYDFTEFELRIGAKVESFDISGGFTVDVNQPSAASFSGHVDGAVNADMSFGELSSFSLNVNGACHIEINGESKTSSILVNGAGSIKAFDFHTENSSIEINGAGSCDVYASDTLDVKINGLGAVTYDGSPKTVNNNSGMIGTVNKR